MIRYFDGNFEEIKKVKDRTLKATYGIDFENKEIELFNFPAYTEVNSAYSSITFDEIEKLKKLIKKGDL